MNFPKTLKEFLNEIVIENHANGQAQNIASWYIGEGEGREWVLNAYESFHGFLRGLEIWHLMDYVRTDGKHLIPEAVEGVDYDENCIFGNIPKDDIPNGCKPYDCGYGGTWGLSSEEQECAEVAAFEMFKRKHPEFYRDIK